MTVAALAMQRISPRMVFVVAVLLAVAVTAVALFHGVPVHGHEAMHYEGNPAMHYE
jgi:hypothetical protein